MNFVKGIVVGSAITAATYMMYTEGMLNKKKIMKKARKLVYKMGMDFKKKNKSYYRNLGSFK